ncbi:MAG TPA: DNA-directed RNA polymerase subunit omega [Pyrinomonadaceae bacterium]|jgi:DNA-directed RNA polymerase subunit omega
MSRVVEAIHAAEANNESNRMDSKYRLIIVAAQRSKQLQRGARPRVDLDPQKHKPTRIALEEVERGKVGFSVIDLTKGPQE